MLNYTRILCPVDIEESSNTGIQLAGALAKESDATLYILHVAKIPAADMDVPVPFSANPRWEKDARSTLEVRAREALDDTVHYQIEVRSGLPDRDIVRVAGELGVDLIVIATHGRRGLKHFAFGSVAERVIREASCPVLVIRPEKSSSTS